MNRTCGDCQACCTVLPIKQLDKPAGTPCPKLCVQGCSIHKTRPEVCRDWNCAWINGQLGPNDRPDKSGVVIWTAALPSNTGMTHVVHANFKTGAKRNKKIMRWLMSLADPVMITQDNTVQLYVEGQYCESWSKDRHVQVSVGARM